MFHFSPLIICNGKQKKNKNQKKTFNDRTINDVISFPAGALICLQYIYIFYLAVVCSLLLFTRISLHGCGTIVVIMHYFYSLFHTCLALTWFFLYNNLSFFVLYFLCFFPCVIVFCPCRYMCTCELSRKIEI